MRWTDKEDAILLSLLGHTTYGHIASQVGRSERAVEARVGQLGMRGTTRAKPVTDERAINGAFRAWPAPAPAQLVGVV